MAEIVGLGQRQFRDKANKGCPTASGSGYDVAEVVAWFRAHEWQPQDQSDTLKDRLLVAEVLKAETDAAIKKVKLRTTLGQLVARAVYVTGVTTLFNFVRQRLQAIPEELASSLPPELRADVLVTLKGKVRLILTEMSAWSSMTEKSKTSSPTKTKAGNLPRRSTGSGNAAKRSPRSKPRD